MIFSFSGQNLQCQDFSGQNLTGADFSNSDIRGTNFTNAILKNANFYNAKAGLPRNRLLGVVSLVLLITTILGLVAGFAPVFTGYLLSGDLRRGRHGGEEGPGAGAPRSGEHQDRADHG